MPIEVPDGPPVDGLDGGDVQVRVGVVGSDGFRRRVREERDERGQEQESAEGETGPRLHTARQRVH